MKHVLMKSLLMSSALALAACSGGGGGSNSAPAADPNAIQQDIHASPVVKLNPLTPEQKQMFATLFQNDSLSTDLFIYDKNNEPTQDQQSRLNKIAALSPIEKAAYSDIEANCQINYVSSPTDSSGQTLIPGHVSNQNSTGSSTGANCPNQTTQSTNTTTTIISSNYADLQSGASTSLSLVETSHSKVVEDQLLLPRAYEANDGMMKLHGVTTSDMKLKTSEQSYEMYSEVSAQMTGVHNKLGNVAITIQARAYGTNAGTINDYVEMVLNMGSLQATIQVYKNSQTTTYYVNGEQFTEDQMHQYFPTFYLAWN